MIWSQSHEALLEVNIKANAPHRSNGPCEPAEEGLALIIVKTGGSPTSKDHGDSFCLRMLLFGTEQINCISLEFPLLHQSPFSADVGEKLYCCLCHRFEQCLMQRGVQRPAGRRSALSRMSGGLAGLFLFLWIPSSQGWVVLGSPQECARWHLGGHSSVLIVRYLFQLVLKRYH